MKQVFQYLPVLLMLVGMQVQAQVAGSFNVGGDLDKFYPVAFNDGGWNDNIATELELGRSNIHRDASTRGSIIAKFRYHVSNCGHLSNFIDANIRQSAVTGQPNRFVAGWKDVTGCNSSYAVIIWLRGNTTYNYKGNYPVTPAVYDGVQHALPYQQSDGPTYSYKTTVDSTVNENGISYANTAYFNGNNNNYFAGKVGIGTTTPRFTLHSTTYNNTATTAAYLWGEYYGPTVGVPGVSPAYYALNVISNAKPDGTSGTGGAQSLLYVRADGNVGIGTTSPQAKLAVKGEIFSTRVRVAQTGWSDFVFEPAYKLPALHEVENFIREHKHLPEIPSSKEVQKDGLDLGEMDKKLLQKIEELTLYIIEQDKRIRQLEAANGNK